MPRGEATVREPRSSILRGWRCRAVSAPRYWPSTPSPWHCHCGATWTLEGAEFPWSAWDLESPAASADEWWADITALLPQVARLTDAELEALAHAVGMEQSKRTPLAAREDPPADSAEEQPSAPLTPEPASEPVPAAPPSPREGRRSHAERARRTMPGSIGVHVTPFGKVWHGDPECKHLYHRGQRRAHIRVVAVTQVDLPPCKDCSRAWRAAEAE